MSRGGAQNQGSLSSNATRWIIVEPILLLEILTDQQYAIQEAKKNHFQAWLGEKSVRFIPFLFFALAAPVFAQLKWEKLEQTCAPSPQDKSVIAKYRFTNVGTAPVTINDVRTSCGCTTAALKKWEYAPGESGEIEANFQFAGHIGHQEKWIFVTTTAAPREPTLLRLIVNIPIAVTIEPEFVMWSIGDQLAPKTIRIVVADGFPAKIVSVQVNNPAVKLELREVRAGKEVEVTVTPPNTSKPENAVLSIRTDYPPQNPETHYAYAQVR